MAPRPLVGLENSADNALALHTRERSQLREDAPGDLLELVGSQEVGDVRSVNTMDTVVYR